MRSKINLLLNISILLCLILCFDISHGANDDYIIISHQNLNGSGLTNLIAAIQSRGHSVGLHLISDGVTCDSIRNIIKNRYFNSGILPRFVLLVGAARYHAGREHIAAAVDSNFIPGYFQLDFFDHTTMYDMEYVAIDSMPLRFPAHHLWDKFPNLFIGRLPAINNQEIQDYTDKLNAYCANTAPASWKDDILYLTGDMDRGGTMPPPGMIVAEMAEVDSNYIPASMERSQIKYSDYGANAAARHQAVANSLDAGKLLVYAMGSAADYLNIVDVLHRGNGDDFDAYADLNSTGKLSVIIGASCSIGQSDGTYNGLRYWPDNFLFAPNRGSIAMLAGAGSTGQNANWFHSHFLFQIMFEHPDWTLGQIATAAKIMARKSRNANLLDTHYMYTYYGDPSLIMYHDSLPFSKNIKHIDFELDTELSKQNCRYNVAGQISSDTCRVSRSIDPGLNMKECYCLKISGYDGKQGSSPRSFWEVMDVHIPIDTSTKFMTFLENVFQHTGNKAEIVINCRLQSGKYLSDSSALGIPKDQYGIKLAARQRTDPLITDNPKFYAFDISCHQGDIITKILVEYDATSQDPIYGNFEGYFDEINFTSYWGSAPEVSEIAAPTRINPSGSATVWVGASDYDVFTLGDSLSFIWTASAGYFTGGGPAPVYHAPSSSQWVNIDLIVSDKGAHQIFRHCAVYIANPLPPPGGCPVLYSLKDGKYEPENVILTGSLDNDRESQIVTDYYPLDIIPDLRGNSIRLRIAENGDKQTYLYGIDLIAYDISGLKEGEELAMTTNGDLVAIYHPIKPFFAQRDNGFTITNLINKKDSNYLVSYDKGSVMIGYNLQDFYMDVISPGKASEYEGGGEIFDPGDKDPVISKMGMEEPAGNILTISEESNQQESRVMGKIYPRIKSTMPMLVDMTNFITEENSHWFFSKLAWERVYQMDYTAFYRYRRFPQIAKIPVQSAVENGTTNVASSLRGSDSIYYKLIPKKYIDLSFPVNVLRNHNNIKLVLKTVGHYVKFSGPELLAEQQVGSIDFQSYPNPFNASTKFQFSLSTLSHVNLNILNILGQKVTELIDKEYPAGKHEIAWNGLDVSGRPVASGIYFAKMQVGAQSNTKRIVVVK
jgi:hypothetical protein